VKRASAVLVIALAAVVGLALSAGTGAGATSKARLVGTVGKNNSFTITLKDSRGHRVRSLRAGTYTVVVHDFSRIHNFELEREHHGNSRDLTDVSFVGTRTVRVTLARGEYKVYCDPHESTMFQDFTVR